MKKLLLSLAFILPMIVFSSCDSNVTKGREAYEKYFYEVLKNPDSFTVYDEQYSKKSNEEVAWVIRYGATNSYGAIITKKVKFTTWRGRMMGDPEEVSSKREIYEYLNPESSIAHFDTVTIVEEDTARLLNNE